MSIICGTDFSKSATQAADVAAALAEKRDEPLMLVHAFEHVTGMGTGGELRASLEEVLGELLNKEAERLRLGNVAVTLRKNVAAERASLTAAPELAVFKKLVHGPPDEVLVSLAQEPEVWLVVVSSLGRRVPARWFLGSVAERTAQTAPVPTLVVRDAAPLLAWLGGERALRVLVGASFSVTSDAALRWVKDLRGLGRCDVVAVHNYWPPEVRQRLDIHGPISLVDNNPQIESVLRRDLTARVTEALGGEPARLRIAVGFGAPADHLAQLAREEQADLVVVGTHQRKGHSRLWHASVSRGVLHHAASNVACVPVPATAPEVPRPIPPLHSVLVATDLSDLANQAVAYSYSVLQAGGTVHLIHVANPDLAANEPYLAVRLQALIPEAAEERGVHTRVEVVTGNDAARTICASADRLGVDMICLGSHGRSGISKALLGSVAQEVMTRSSKPLLVIRKERED